MVHHPCRVDIIDITTAEYGAIIPPFCIKALRVRDVRTTKDKNRPLAPVAGQRLSHRGAVDDQGAWTDPSLCASGQQLAPAGCALVNRQPPQAEIQRRLQIAENRHPARGGYSFSQRAIECLEAER